MCAWDAGKLFRQMDIWVRLLSELNKQFCVWFQSDTEARLSENTAIKFH